MKYKYVEGKGVTTASGRRISSSLTVGLSRSGKTLLVYNRKGRVLGRVSNAKKSPTFISQSKLRKESNTPISYRGITANNWRDFQDEFVDTYGYEYH